MHGYVEKSSELVLDLQQQNEYYKRVVKTTTHTGVSSNGKISVSKTAHGGSNPSTPAKEKESDDGLVPFFRIVHCAVSAARLGEAAGILKDRTFRNHHFHPDIGSSL